MMSFESSLPYYPFDSDVIQKLSLVFDYCLVTFGTYSPIFPDTVIKREQMIRLLKSSAELELEM